MTLMQPLALQRARWKKSRTLFYQNLRLRWGCSRGLPISNLGPHRVWRPPL